MSDWTAVMNLYLLGRPWILLCLSWTVSALSLIISLIALFQSRKSLQTVIPEPQSVWANERFLVLRIRPEDEGHFGIREVIGAGPIEALVNIRPAELEKMLALGVPLGPSAKRINFYPPVTAVILSGPSLAAGARVCIVSRSLPHARRWIKFPRLGEAS